MAKIWADFTPRLAVHLPDVPSFTVTDEAVESAREFFQEARAWRSNKITLATTVALQADYTITNPTDQEICGLQAVWLDSKEIKVAAPGDEDDYEPGEEGLVERVQLVDTVTVRLLPTPTTAGNVVKGVVAYMPALTAAGLSDALFALHWRPIMHKIAMRLMLQQGKPWFNGKLAQWHSDEYDRLALAAGTLAGPVSRTPLRVKLSPM